MGHFVISGGPEVGVLLLRTQRVIRFLLQLEVWNSQYGFLCITDRDDGVGHAIPIIE
jgi:hypothetical protein